jgi:hypothetical protein
MLIVIVPPFFCPLADGLSFALEAGPANAAASRQPAPTAAMAAESKILLGIDLLSMKRTDRHAAGAVLTHPRLAETTVCEFG